ncbi:MAG: murein DD-endopeptidase MepM/ murein hydrolase activator NlpD [Acidimicrobiales bacterium]|jgi:murein DD-endopeptidase MepM/ murein hydrolase activator NlpD
MCTRKLIVFFIGLLIIPILSPGTDFVFAQSEVQKLQTQISDKNNRLSSIEQEIAQYEAALLEVGAEKSTLQSAINRLSLERKKVLADISYTENKITATDLTIDKLTLEISSTEQDITQNEASVAAILQKVYVADNESFIEVFLRQENLSQFWNEFEELEQVKMTMLEKLSFLDESKKTLEAKREQNTSQRKSLLELKNQYDDQQSILDSNRATKSELLSATKNEETTFQALLKNKQTARDKLLAEVRDIESQIQFILDPNTIPIPGTPVFQWPLSNPYITQYFGYTKFALSGAYNGNKHNGMDLGAPIGTKLNAPLTGTVRMIGNTDLVPGCYSWGKWLLIDHPNGLSTMFAHMSQIAVSPGQKVGTGQVVGYVGSTGYSTGPHLHYTLYVTEGVVVKQFNQFKKVTGCGAALSPFAAVEAYLDPLDYLPAL